MTSVGVWTTLVHQVDLFPQLKRSIQDSQKGTAEYTQSLKGMLGMQTSAFAGKLSQAQKQLTTMALSVSISYSKR